MTRVRSGHLVRQRAQPALTWEGTHFLMAFALRRTGMSALHLASLFLPINGHQIIGSVKSLHQQIVFPPVMFQAEAPGTD
jgi:hypothetical protein